MSSATAGRFITFEGGEGVGKSTQMRLLTAALTAEGHDVTVTREPGGTPGAEAVRHVVLGGAAKRFGVEIEAALFAAARRDNVEQLIRPALASGHVVLCDRYMDSSRVYQGAVGGVETWLMDAFENAVTEGARPHLTFVFDLPAERALARMRARQGTGDDDRYESEGLDAHRRRRDAFLAIARAEPNRCVVIDADRDRDAIAHDVVAAARRVLPAPAAV